MVEYTTGDGLRLDIGRIDRTILDPFFIANPPPEPPTAKVEVFAGFTEDIPVTDNPEYLAALFSYRVQMGYELVDIIADAVNLPDDGEANALQIAGLAETKADLLRFRLSEIDLENIVELVLYQSTVTERGIQEAAERLNVTWAGKPVLALRPPSSAGRVGMLYEHRQAARFGGYRWSEFCALPGPEQSEEFAFYRINARLTWLQTQQR